MTRLSLTAVAFLAMCSPAHAQQMQCGPAPAVVHELSTRYGEEISNRGIAANGAMVLVYANPETGSWTWLAVSPDGLACVVASGEGFERLAFGKPGEPS